MAKEKIFINVKVTDTDVFLKFIRRLTDSMDKFKLDYPDLFEKYFEHLTKDIENGS